MSESELHGRRARRPMFSVDDAGAILSRLYHSESVIRELPSERDQNFHVRTAGGDEYVLKIANVDESRSALDFQNTAMQRVHDSTPAVSCPRIIATAQGELIGTAEGPDGASHFIRLATFIPGVPLGKFRPHSSEVLTRVGILIGTVDSALSNFSHPAADRDLYWDIANAEKVISTYKHLIPSRDRQALIEEFKKVWHERVVPVLPSLRRRVAHNDANDYNIIVGGKTGSIGLIDFGDVLRTWTVAGAGIAAAYVMLSKPDPIAAAAHVVGGYHKAFPLTETEMEVLYYFACMRLCMSVTIAAHQQQIEPRNEYLKISEEPAWALLEKLRDTNPRLAQYAFRDSCGLPASPATGQIVSWLKAAGAQNGFASVVPADLKSQDAVVLDFSIGSMELGILDNLGDTAKVTELLFRHLEERGARAGIGRYNEARGVYTSGLFQADGNDGPESRTVHLGIDVFMRAGSPVFAPLDGFVHSFRNNAALLDYGPTIVLRHPVPGCGEFYTLYGHLSVDSLDGLSAGMPVAKGARIAAIGNYPENGNWAPHLHFQIVTDMLDRQGEFPGVAAPSKRTLWLSLSPDPNLILGIPESHFPKLQPDFNRTLEMRRQHIGPSLSLSYRQPLKIVRGYRQYLYDETGRAYLDAVNNVAHVGHCHPKVVRVMQAQMAVLNTNTRYLHDNIIEYARRLCEKLPESLSVCFFVNSGSEANDLALRLARTHTRTKDTIVVDGAYHGNLTSLIEISPYKFDGPGGSGVPAHVRKIPTPDTYRRDGADYREELRDAVRNRPNVFIVESLLSCDGQIVLPSGYLADAFRTVRSAGGVCIADEVQVGFGRCGTHFWGFETQDSIPDIVTLGKPMGNGHPLGAVITTPEIAASFNSGMEYFNTFGGNPVSCAAGLAVLDVLEQEKLQLNALRAGAHLKSRLDDLAGRHSLIGNVRGLGLFVGVELVNDRTSLAPAAEQTAYIVERMKESGILVSAGGTLHNTIKIKPPLVFTESDADWLVDTLDKVLFENGCR